MNQRTCRRPLKAKSGFSTFFLLIFSTLLLTSSAVGQEPLPKSFDARGVYNAELEMKPSSVQRQAEQALRGQVPGLAVNYDRTSGVARNLRSHDGYLTEPQNGEVQEIGLEFINAQRELLDSKSRG